MDAAANELSVESVVDEIDVRELRGTGLEDAVARARDGLLAQQDAKGYWCYELEADCTISAEYILMMHFMDEIDAELQAKIAVYLRDRQQDDGGWPLYQGGRFDLSCTVKAYYALKLAGDSPDTPHMLEARELILAHGGAAHSNVFTRIALAMFEQVPWRAAPVVPVELMLQPRWSPFHLSKVSYWSRTVVVPLAILCSLRVRARNPLGVGIRELFLIDPELEKNYFQAESTTLGRLFLVLDKAARRLEPFVPRWIRNRAVQRAEAWIVERLNGEGGLGAIFPAMVNAYEALDLLGYAKNDQLRITARKAIDDLLVVNEHSAYCQPCVSPVWDTALACLALQEEGSKTSKKATRRALNWLQDMQLLEEPGDWSDDRPELAGGGWPFQFQNDFYPDLDDTGVVGWAMDNAHDERYDEAVQRAANWLRGMQSRNGGFASFDVDNDHYYLNKIPFADHGALLDPPTADVSARCLALFSRIDDGTYAEAMQRCIAYLRQEQEADGSWFGRWGTNYVYGTWSVLSAFEQAGIPGSDPSVQRAVNWLKSKQRADGGWGESNDSYFEPGLAGEDKASTAFQTAWAMLGLMAAGEAALAPELRRGAAYLMQTQCNDGLWSDPGFTAPGFPRVFHLKYHGYDKFFPLWALALYRNRQSARGE